MAGWTVERENTQTLPLHFRRDGELCSFLMLNLRAKFDIKKKNEQNRFSRTAARTVQRENTQTFLLQFAIDGDLCGFLMLNLHVKLEILKKE